jgi:hypothetical protein
MKAEFDGQKGRVEKFAKREEDLKRRVKEWKGMEII